MALNLDAVRDALSQVASAARNQADSVEGGSASRQTGGARRIPSESPRQSTADRTRQSTTNRIAGTPGASSERYRNQQRQRWRQEALERQKEDKRNQADEAADDADDFKAGQSESGQQSADGIATDYDDQFYADFNEYSRANLDGQGLYDFLEVDPYSQEDYEAWEAFWNDPTMGEYYADQKEEYGDFDAYWRAMIANNIDDIMASNDLQRQYFNNAGGDTMLQIYRGVANEGFVPDVSGDQWQQDELTNLYASDPELAALTMMYIYGMNGVLDEDSELDLETDPYAVAKLNDYLQLGNMQFGTGDGYSTEVGDVPEYESVEYVDPNMYQRSVEENLAAVPGYGLPDLGIRAAMNDRYDVGYQLRPGVDDAYAQVFNTGEEGQQQ